tara:strand:- start:1645 stop:3084 length:1440 start_codon:yes stop_codon:yes gene_type:complete
MNNKTKLHMSTDEFRKAGYKAIDWIADYYEKIEDYPVMSQLSPNEIINNLPDNPPIEGKKFDDILKDMDLLMNGITHWQSPNFHAFFPCSTSGPGILGDLLSTGLAVNGMNWITSPSATELEIHMLDWLVKMLDLPEYFLSSSSGGGAIQDTASSSSLIALLAAREKITKTNSNKAGCSGNLTVYTSSQAHSSIEKAVKIAGIGTNNLRLVKTDKNFAMDVEHLKQLIDKDIKDKLKPSFVCATVGTTSSTALDPVEKIGKICKNLNIWLHVDSAMAGPAAICPEFRFVNKGLTYANSYTFNPHKWMLTNFDCSIFYIQNKKYLLNALSIMPEYLKNKQSSTEQVTDLRDWGIPLGRRFRALKLWSVINYYGIKGIQDYIRNDMHITQKLKEWISKDDRFEIIAPTPLTLICFRLKGNNDENEKLLYNINKSGSMYLSHTKLDNKYTLRFSIGTSTSSLDHVKNSWKKIQEFATQLRIS